MNSADSNPHKMLQMPNASAMLDRGEKSSARLAGSNSKGIKSIHSMIHRDKSHEKLRHTRTI